MQSKEICAGCRVTKKALEYYEKKGLIAPKLLENGYRDYSEQDAAALREISVLRRCGIGTAELKEILSSRNRAAALEKVSYLAGLRAQRLEAVRRSLDSLIQDYDIDREFDALGQLDETLLTLKERLALAFPGNYGVFVSLHFGRFLDEPTDTPEKLAACEEMIAYLDQAGLSLSPELSEFLESFASAEGTSRAIELEDRSQESIGALLDDVEGYLEKNRESITEYLNYRLSPEFATSPMGEMYGMMLEFQKSTGYQEHFLDPMKRISTSYREYLNRLEQANKKMIEMFPSAKELDNF